MNTTKILSIKRIKDSEGKANYSLTFQGRLEGITQEPSLLSQLNFDDARFNTSKPQLAWVNKASKEGIEKTFGITEFPVNVGDVIELNIEAKTVSGSPVYLQLNESTIIPKNVALKADNEAEYTSAVLNTCKQREVEGIAMYYLSTEGKAIFRTIDVVDKKPTHRSVEMLKDAEGKTKQLTEDEFLDNCVTLQDRVTVSLQTA